MQAGGQRFDSAYLHHTRKWLSGRASPCQGEGREFESRLPLQIFFCQQRYRMLFRYLCFLCGSLFAIISFCRQWQGFTCILAYAPIFLCSETVLCVLSWKSFIACPRSALCYGTTLCILSWKSFIARPRSPDICLSVCLTLDCVQLGQTDCAIVHFNLDRGNKRISGDWLE